MSRQKFVWPSGSWNEAVLAPPAICTRLPAGAVPQTWMVEKTVAGTSGLSSIDPNVVELFLAAGVPVAGERLLTVIVTPMVPSFRAQAAIPLKVAIPAPWTAGSAELTAVAPVWSVSVTLKLSDDRDALLNCTSPLTFGQLAAVIES